MSKRDLGASVRQRLLNHAREQGRPSDSVASLQLLLVARADIMAEKDGRKWQRPRFATACLGSQT